MDNQPRRQRPDNKQPVKKTTESRSRRIPGKDAPFAAPEKKQDNRNAGFPERKNASRNSANDRKYSGDERKKTATGSRKERTESTETREKHSRENWKEKKRFPTDKTTAKPATGKTAYSRDFKEKKQAAGTFRKDTPPPAKRNTKPSRKEKESDPFNAPFQYDDKVYAALEEDTNPAKQYRDDQGSRRKNTDPLPVEAPMTLNKYIAHSGASSRRDAAEFVKLGKVRVNGELVLDPGYRVAPGDQITLSGKKMTPQKGLVYILLNKPKDYITTTDDPEGRKTVLELVQSAGIDRLFPVGRLDRNTTGLLLLTNDGTLAHKLSHPSYLVKKIYQVTLNKKLSEADYRKIVNGLELEDGKVEVDEIAYLDNRNEIGLEIHSGRNRIVRRIFESLGYEVDKLDRVMYAGLTKKNLPRGKWRFLLEKEIVILKHFKN